MNETDSDHPRHPPFQINSAGRFLVLSRGGEVEPNLVWQDAMLVRTGEVVDTLLDVSTPGLWMVHHIAGASREREDIQCPRGQITRRKGRMRMSTAMAEDPVCGMRIDPDDAAATAEHEGRMYYFCSQTCHDAFVADPSTYA